MVARPELQMLPYTLVRAGNPPPLFCKVFCQWAQGWCADGPDGIGNRLSGAEGLKNRRIESK
jgi:hypothetical protein